MKNLIALTCLVLLNSLANAQIGVGEWRDHFSFKYSLSVAESSQSVFVSSRSGVLVYSKKDKTIKKLTKTNKLSDIEISSIFFSKNNHVLIVGYLNGNVDLVYDDSVFNLSDIKRKMINASKKINHIYVKDNLAYLSCGFGIVVLNLNRKEVKDTYYIGDLGSFINVNQVTSYQDSLYAATSHGIFVANNNSNLANYNNWRQITSIPSHNENYSSIYIDNGNILANQYKDSENDILRLYQSGIWSVLSDKYSDIKSIKAYNSEILVTTPKKILIYNQSFLLNDSIKSTGSVTINPVDVSTIDNQTYWVADRGNSLIKVDNQMQVISPNSPYTSQAYNIDVDKDKVVVVPGGITPSFNNNFINASLYVFDKEQWQSYFNYESKDYIVVKIDPTNSNRYFAGSWGDGVFEYENNKLKANYNNTNSSLQTIGNNDGFVRIGGLAFDSDNNLWVTNSSVDKPISVRKANGEWLSYSYNNIIRGYLTSQIIVTRNNHKWLVLSAGNGLFVFDDKKTLDDESDDSYKKLNVIDENGIIITNRTHAISEDLDGNIWVGTDKGIVVYYNPEEVFENQSFHAKQIVLTIGEATGILLEKEAVNTIAVDGANRKWLGTENSGAYLVSKDGTEQINHFTKDNSPLPSNKIYNISINHESGEIFFATEKGLVSYRGSATMGGDDYRDVYVYPNPVREDYEGDITIRGLVANVTVKITDISGSLVYETKAEGGQAVWNGKNFNGEKPSTGVYLVFCTNTDGTKTYVTKFLFVK
ncbi:MAG: T9SS type A sorting domain-containing protein [Bacteroidales bacterium]|nr:T9SS type A sorting domain-containing protein [Bacteroidales bacterium]